MSIGRLENEGDLKRFILDIVDSHVGRSKRTAEPVGVIHAYGGAAAPASYLMCDGSVVSRTAYPALFTVVGTAFNTGGEAGTDFRLPDLRGRAPMGVDGAAGRLSAADALGNSGGTETSNMPNHSHGGATGNTDIDHQHYNMQLLIPTGGGPAVNSLSPFGTVQQGTSGMSGNNPHGHSITAEGTGGAQGNLPPYQIVNWIIRAR